MTKSAQIWLALGMDQWPAIRKAAALAAFDYLMIQHKLGAFPPFQAQINRLRNRFRLGDWLCALSAHYPVK
jgi:hypothetical protein